MMRAALPIVGALAVTGCFRPVIAPGDPCETGNNWCPEPLQCIDQICRSAPVDGGGGDGTIPPETNVMFVTSGTFKIPTGATPDETLAAADLMCTNAAAGRWPGPFVAWLSTTAHSARSRLGTGRGWVRTDGMPFGDTIESILDGVVYYPPLLDELAQPLAFVPRVLTNTKITGAAPAPSSCADLTVADSSVSVAGIASAGTKTWTDVTDLPPLCSDANLHLYCFETDHSTPVAAPQRPGNLAFVSAAMFSNQGGIAMADATCQQEVAGSFALIASATKSPYDRLVAAAGHAPTKPFVRHDGVVVSADLQGHALSAPINLTLAGTYQDNTLVWFGAQALDLVGMPITTCNDWLANGQGLTAETTYSTFDALLTQCDFPLAVYCVEAE